MKYEKSCGVIPYLIKNNDIHFLLIKQKNNVIGFPKGHVENNETEVETALRECKEETNLTVTLIENFKEATEYIIEEIDVHKTVVFFLGKIDNLNYLPQEAEISDIYLLNYQEAYKKINFEDTKAILERAYKFIQKNI